MATASDASLTQPEASAAEYVAPLIPMTGEEQKITRLHMTPSGYIVFFNDDHDTAKHMEYLRKRMNMATIRDVWNEIGFSNTCWEPLAYYAGLHAEGVLAHVRSDPGVKQVLTRSGRDSWFDLDRIRQPRTDPYHKMHSRKDAGKWMVLFKTHPWNMVDHCAITGVDVPSFKPDIRYNLYYAEMPLEQARALLADLNVRSVEREYSGSFYGL